MKDRQGASTASWTVPGSGRAGRVFRFVAVSGWLILSAAVGWTGVQPATGVAADAPGSDVPVGDPQGAGDSASMGSAAAVPEPASTEPPAPGPLSAEERAAADVQPLELDPVEVTGEQMTFEQEVMLRLVRQALDRPRSVARNSFEDWVCWFDRPTGTRFYYLSCARQGDLYALQPRQGQPLTATRGEGSYGTILTTTRPVNRARLRRILREMPGSDDFDREFVMLARQGERPPRDIPDDRELDRFARAFQAVSALVGQGASDDQLAAAIAAAGLDVDRYNRIGELTERYQSIENEVAVRVNGDSPEG